MERPCIGVLASVPLKGLAEGSTKHLTCERMNPQMIPAPASEWPADNEWNKDEMFEQNKFPH